MVSAVSVAPTRVPRAAISLVCAASPDWTAATFVCSPVSPVWTPLSAPSAVVSRVPSAAVMPSCVPIRPSSRPIDEPCAVTCAVSAVPDVCSDASRPSCPVTRASSARFAAVCAVTWLVSAVVLATLLASDVDSVWTLLVSAVSALAADVTCPSTTVSRPAFSVTRESRLSNASPTVSVRIWADAALLVNPVLAIRAKASRVDRRRAHRVIAVKLLLFPEEI